MATITEDYVSFETAKLLKEKGFQQLQDNCGYFTTEMVYSIDTDDDGEHHFAHQYPAGVYNKDKYIAAPTLQMAMKWLREVHNLCVEPYRTASGYLYTISKIWTGSEIYSDEFNGDDEASGQWTTYEKACEAAIKYCLEHLI